MAQTQSERPGWAYWGRVHPLPQADKRKSCTTIQGVRFGNRPFIGHPIKVPRKRVSGGRGRTAEGVKRSKGEEGKI